MDAVPSAGSAQADLNDVYRPDEDPQLRASLGGAATSSDILFADDAAAPALTGAAAAALLFGDDDAGAKAAASSSAAAAPTVANLLGDDVEPQAAAGAPEVTTTDFFNPVPDASVPTTGDIVFGDADAGLLGFNSEQRPVGGKAAGHARAGSAMSVIDLGDTPLDIGGSSSAHALAGTATAAAAQARNTKEKSLMDDLPPGVTVEEYRQAIIDLSKPAATEASESAAAAPAGAGLGIGGGGGGHGGSAASSRAMPPTAAGTDAGSSRRANVGDFKDAQAFGSDDLFGGGDKSKIDQVLDMLPQPVKQQLQAAPCLRGTADTVVSDDEAGDAVIQRVDQAGVREVSGAGQVEVSFEEQQRRAALERACEGQWVPTYMRQQLRENGHTTLPPSSMPNAHEYDARRGPPTAEATFADVAEDLQETAQNMLNFVWVVLSSLAFQCQMCSHHSASVAHEQVVAFGENLCTEVRNVNAGEEAIGPIADEESAGYGPMRSRLRRSMQGVSFQQLLDTARRTLITNVAPPEFRRAVKSRELLRNTADAMSGTEDWVFHVEVSPDVLPQEALQHVWPLTCRERWHIQTRESRAFVEIVNDPCSGPVAVVLRIDIDGTAEGGCEVDSRLYARPQEHGAVLPRGLVEHLCEAHHQYSESLRDVTLALVGDGAGRGAQQELASLAMGAALGTQGQAAPGADSAAAAPLPVVQWPVPHKRPPSWAAEGPAPRSMDSAPGRSPRVPAQRGVGGLPTAPGAAGVDASMLMQVAEGI